MKHFQKKFAVIALLMATVTILVHCTKRNQIIEEETTSPSDVLFSRKVSAGPAVNGTVGYVWDGAVDPLWASAKKLNVRVEVPNPGQNTFPGYTGQTTDVTLQSVYDDQYIYFLTEWVCEKFQQSAWWYYNPVTKLWAQESTNPALDANGIRIRDGFNQDKFAMMWNINNSTLTFNSQGCWANCHLNVPTYTINGTTITTVPAQGSRMRTTSITEKLDLWQLRTIQVQNFSQMSDTYVDWGAGAVNAGGRNNDAQLNATDGGLTNNRQSLKLDGTGANVNVPMWFIPNASNYTIIKVSDTSAGGTAIKITGVSSTGVLSYSGGTIDPNVGTDYQQVGPGVGAKCIPGSIDGAFTGSRADISANVYYTGTGWRAIFKRKLNTGDVLAQDINFTGLADQSFGIAVMFNHASTQHAIVPKLTLKFEK